MALLSKSGYGQVEPNHLSSQRTGQIYAQLPVEAQTLASIATPGVVQNGMFLDYDYAKNAVVAPASGGSKLTMLVMNEIRTYADFLTPKDYAQIATGTTAGIGLANEAPAFLKSATLNYYERLSASTTVTIATTVAGAVVTGSVISISGLTGAGAALNGSYTVQSQAGFTATINTAATSHITASTTVSSTIVVYGAGTASFNTVYPRLFKVEAGDIITTNLVASSNGLISDFLVGDALIPGTDGVLVKSTNTTASVVFKVVGISTTPDLQNALKLQCVAAG